MPLIPETGRSLWAWGKHNLYSSGEDKELYSENMSQSKQKQKREGYTYIIKFGDIEERNEEDFRRWKVLPS